MSLVCSIAFLLALAAFLMGYSMVTEYSSLETLQPFFHFSQYILLLSLSSIFTWYMNLQENLLLEHL
jgi:hypothetical protein